MITFSPETRKEILIERRKRCEVCGEKQGLTFHHIIHNTKTNRKIYGDKLQSKENCMLLCIKHHSNYSLYDRERLKQLRSQWK
jgi:hypothetical protein